MIKAILFISIFLFYANARADIFDKNKSNQDQLTASVNNDKSSYYYQGQGLDYNLPVNTNTLQVGGRGNFKFGCSGYDFNTSFLQQFNAEALKGTVIAQAQQVMAAAPLLLLDYASPSLADVIKHFQNLVNGRLSLDVARCQEIETAVDDKFDKLRKASEKECLEQNKGMGLSAAMDYCKKQPDPFGYLKDINGITLSAGGRVNAVEEMLKRLHVPTDEAKKFLAVTGDTTISKDGYQENGRLLPYETMVQQNKDVNMTSFVELLNEYRTNNSVSDSELQPFSRPGVQINRNFLTNLLLLDKNQRIMVISKLSSHWAYLDANETYRKVVDYYNAGISDPNTGSLMKDILKEKRDKAEYELSKARDHYQELTVLKEIIASVNNDADISRAQLINEADGTQYIGQDENEQARRRGLLNNF